MQDRSDCDRSQWRAQQSGFLSNVAGKCLTVSIFYAHLAGASALRVYHRLGYMSRYSTMFQTAERVLLRVRACPGGCQGC
jgi:hypothetical protein